MIGGWCPASALKCMRNQSFCKHWSNLQTVSEKKAFWGPQTVILWDDLLRITKDIRK